MHSLPKAAIEEKALSGFNFSRLSYSLTKMFDEERAFLDAVMAILMSLMQQELLSDEQAQIVRTDRPFYTEEDSLQMQLDQHTKPGSSLNLAELFLLLPEPVEETAVVEKGSDNLKKKKRKKNKTINN